MRILLSFLFMLLFLSQAIFADDNETINNSCIGEQIEELRHISDLTNPTSYVQSGTVQLGSDTVDYFHFRPALTGDISFSFTTDPKRVDLDISIVNCDGSDVKSFGNSLSGSETFSVTSDQTVYIKMLARDPGLASYDMTITFTPDPKTFDCSKPKPFSVRKSIILPGDLIAIGNSNICADDDYNGVCDDDQEKRNDDSNIIFINASSSTDINASDTSENTTSAELNLPAGATVTWAGLYWQGEVWDIKTDDGYLKKERANSINFKTPNGTYQELVADEHYYVNVKVKTNYSWADYYDIDRYEQHYQSYKDVTSLVSQNGSYSVANIQATLGKLAYPGVEAAWTLQIIYELAGEEPRSIAVNDGYVALYSNADVGEDYADEINSLYSAGCLTDQNHTGVYGNTVSFDITGFLTPKTAGFTTDMTIFLTESDPDGANAEEFLRITKKDGSIHSVDGPGAWNYEIKNKDGSDNLDRNPNYIYPIGMTLKNYQETDALDTEQSSTHVTFGTGYDRLLLGVIGFATDLRKPLLCYDYAYKQNNRYFTETNDGTQDPHISGAVVSGDPIDVSLYIRNKEDSDVSAQFVNVNILDINTSQATYITGSTRITLPNSLSVDPVNENSINSSPSDILDISIGTVNSLEYFYTYFELDPSLSDIDIPIKARVDYNVTLPTDNGPITIPYKVYLNSDVELCTASSGDYEPVYGGFNVAHKNTFLNNGVYNIPTQVAKKIDNFMVVSYDTNNSSTLNTERFLTTTVGIEIVDVGAYQDSAVACNEPGSALSPRVWVIFDNNTSRTDFNKSVITDAIADGRISDQILNQGTPIATAEEFMSKARENAAFRVTYNVLDENGTLVHLEEMNHASGEKRWNVTNFPDVVKLGDCLADVDGNAANTDTVAQFCSNAGTNVNSAMDATALATCMECVYGYNVQYDCSRDNFAIRPEAFLVKIYDNNESNASNNPRIELPYISDISAGYQYRYDVNATSHFDELAVEGYTESYVLPNTDHNMTYYWRPTTPLTGCNDTADKYPSIYLFDGAAVNNQNRSNNVGRYELEMRDASWTKVDQNPSHHVAPYYTIGDDCTVGESFVPSNNTPLTSATIGCTISSNHVNQDRTSVVYSDYNVTVHPYDFNISTISFNKGINSVAVNTNDYVYMNNILADTNMSVRYTGQIKAVGANTVPLSNFVADCYAENISLDINTSALPATPHFNYRLRETNTSNGLIFNDTNGSNGGNPALPAVLIPQSNFLKNSFGVSDMEFNMNFDRNVTGAVNPITQTYNSFNVSCQTPSNCDSYADMSTNHLPDSNLTSLSSVTHIYGRVHTPRHRVADPDPSTLSTLANIPLYYEFYCQAPGCTIEDYNATSALPLSPIGLLSPDDVRWYIQAMHNITTDGEATQTRTRNGTDDARFAGGMSIDAGAMSATYQYDGVKGYPYKATIELGTQNWLIYNRYNPAATVNDFELEFTTTGNWSGRDESGMGLDGNSSTNVNRRVEW